MIWLKFGALFAAMMLGGWALDLLWESLFGNYAQAATISAFVLAGAWVVWKHGR